MQRRYYANEAFQSQIFMTRKQGLHAGMVTATINVIYWQIYQQQKR
jgi:hypothetical protein